MNANLCTILVMIGLVADIAGALMLSRAYSSTAPWWQLPFALLMVWTRNSARAVLDSNEINPEDKRTALRGLSLVVLGFVLQAAGLWCTVIFPVYPAGA